MNELVKAGYIAKSLDGSELILTGNEVRQNQDVHINTYNDHRMAMAFAPLSFLRQSITVDEPGVVSKSYPGFWNDLLSAGFRFA